VVTLVKGRHIYGELYGSPSDLLNDEEFLTKTVVKAAEHGMTTILEVKYWRVGGEHGGVSVLALVVESHIAIHTWPGNNYATVDVYTCGDRSDPWKVFYYIVNALKPKHYVVHYSDRSQLPLYESNDVPT